MKLIKKLGTRKEKDYVISWGLFWCPCCKKEVEKISGNGKKYQSCGCMWRKHGHGFTHHHLYAVWHHIIQRCYNQN